MGIRKYRGQIVCDKHWPDGSRTIRVWANRTKAKQLLDRINASIADGTWYEFKQKLMLRDRVSVTVGEYAVTYMEDYVKSRNKRKTFKRKETSLRALLPCLAACGKSLPWGQSALFRNRMPV